MLLRKLRDTLSWKTFEIEPFIRVLLVETDDFFDSFDELQMHQLC